VTPRATPGSSSACVEPVESHRLSAIRTIFRAASRCESDRSRVWLLSELYRPEVTSTGTVMTGIAEGLARRFAVAVICAQPTYSRRGMRAPAREVNCGVSIERCWSARLDKNRITFRLANACTLAATMVTRLTAQVRRGDTVISVTNPPVLPLLATAVALVKRARTVLIVHDVYPEVMTVTGVSGERSAAVRLLRRAMRWLYSRADRIIVVGRDMAEVISSQCHDGMARVVVVPNWAELDAVSPADRSSNRLLSELGLQDRFVLQYAGNLGRPNDVEILADAADRLRDDRRFHLLVIGSGARLPELRREVERRRLDNVTLLGPLPREEQQVFLNACDAAVHTFVPGMYGLGVPSRMYNVMAAGKPLIAAVDAGSEPALVIEEQRMGWVVPAADGAALASAVRDAMSDPERLAKMGRNGRAAAESLYNHDAVIQEYVRVVSAVSPGALTLPEVAGQSAPNMVRAGDNEQCADPDRPPLRLGSGAGTSILVTGANGFIGSHLCPALVAAGYGVRAAVRTSAGRVAKGAERYVMGDLAAAEWDEALDGVTHVVHLAGLAHQLATRNRDRRSDFENANATATRRLAEAAAARAVRRIVFASSAGAETADDDYGRSKRLAEQHLEEVLAAGQTDWCTLRPPLVYGPGQRGNMERLLRLVRLGIPLPLGAVANQRSFLYVGNLVSAIMTALMHPGVSRRTFAVCDDEALSTPDLLRRIGRSAGVRVRLAPVPVSLLGAVGVAGDVAARVLRRPAPVDTYSVERLCGSLTLDASPFREATGWSPPYGVEDALTLTYSNRRA
jgi:colanic acid biosynthesis glycosyl transferase WcaI